MKRPAKFCGGGHRQSQKWKPGDACWQCEAAERQRIMSDPASIRREREAELVKIGPIPEVMTIRCADGPSQTFKLPKGRRFTGRRVRP